MLFVAKKDGSLRLVIDARPANSLMVKPPHTHTHTPLCSSETLASIESTEAAGRSFGEQMCISYVLVYSGMADVDRCFHRIRIIESLGQYLTFPGSARELGIVGIMFRGGPLIAESQI